MEPRHRRSIREANNIGWTISDDQEDHDATIAADYELLNSNGALSAAASSSFGVVDGCGVGGGRIYPGLFAEDDAAEHNGNTGRSNNAQNGAGGPAGRSNNIGPKGSGWPPIKSVTVEEQAEDDDDVNGNHTTDDDEYGEEEEENEVEEEEPLYPTSGGTMSNNNNANSVPAVVRHQKNTAQKIVSRRSLPASFQHQPQLQKRWSPQQQQQDVQQTWQRRRHQAVVDDDEEDDQALFPRQNLIIFLIGLSVLLLFVLPPILFTLFSSDANQQQQQQQQHLSLSDRLRIFRAELQQMLNQTRFANSAPRTKYNIEKTLNYLAEQMLRRRRQRRNSLMNGGANEEAATGGGGGTFGQYHPAPLVLLISSHSSSTSSPEGGGGGPIVDSDNNDDVHSLAEQYAVLLLKHWPEYRFINVTAQSDHTKSNLSNLLMRPLLLSSSQCSTTAGKSSWLWWWWPSLGQNCDDAHDDDNVLVLFHRIERLRGDAPLFLHSLADPESSPIVEAAGRHNVLIILTMAPPGDDNDDDGKSSAQNDAAAFDDNDDAMLRRDCEGQIASSLLSNWHSDAVTEDQIRPIVARISAIPLCVF
ncbi:hypothetical protein niasHS_013373 [Heterodera schachtii]|uniref:Uncharacterized protein n=1 Tax=Heterodera schachtii TaxID=97005 RepID=A0ABD2ID37_HETSC